MHICWMLLSNQNFELEGHKVEWVEVIIGTAAVYLFTYNYLYGCILQLNLEGMQLLLCLRNK